MYFIYNLVTIILTIILSPVILLALLLKPKFRAGFWQKIGFYPRIDTTKPVVWFHAVSVGEVNAIETLIKKFKENNPSHFIVVTTVTRTGQQVANSRLSKTADRILYFPFDLFFSVKSAIRAINPKLTIVAETEIWPNFSHQLKEKNIPLIIVNGRISPNSYKGYKRFSIFFKNILKNYSVIAMQTRDDLQRIVDIGSDPSKTEVMGNLKFDVSEIMNQEEVDKLKNSLTLKNNRLIMAGSTHNGEDEVILNIYKQLKAEFADLKLMIAPRHPERQEKVLGLIAQTGFKHGKRSQSHSFTDKDIILLDTMGELGKMYAASYLAFVGGSFSNTGGHNPLEPAIYGIPILSGPTVFNFKDIYKFMLEANAAIIVDTEDELYLKTKQLLSNDALYNQISHNCLKIFDKNKGALEYALNLISKYL